MSAFMELTLCLWFSFMSGTWFLTGYGIYPFFFFLVCLCMSLSFVIFVLLLALMFSFCVCFISCIFPVLDVINEWNVLQPFKLSWLSWLLKTYWLLVGLVTSKMFLTVSKRVEWNWWGQVFVLCWLWLTFRYLRNGWPVS